MPCMSEKKNRTWVNSQKKVENCKMCVVIRYESGMRYLFDAAGFALPRKDGLFHNLPAVIHADVGKPKVKQ